MADIEFFFDPVCPWAWITSRFALEVTNLRKLEIEWRFISLKLINSRRDYEKEFPPGYINTHGRGHRMLRVASAVRQAEGNLAVANLYTALGNKIHLEAKPEDLDSEQGVVEVLKLAGLSDTFASEADNPDHDQLLREETDLVISRAGNDIGTPVITFAPPNGPSFFGPVISRIPRGNEALELWDAVEKLAYFSGFAELKRSLRSSPNFG